MATKYRFGVRRRSTSFHIKGVVGIALLVIVLVAAGTYYLSLDQFKAEPTKVNVSQNNPSSNDVTFDEKYFTITLPQYWILKRSQQTPTVIYWFQSMERFATNRFLTVYIDNDQSDFAVTHMLPVLARGNQLELGNMSNRCSDFAGPDINSTTDSNRASDVRAKWEGINFICGLRYYDDYIAGTSSLSDGVNKITLTGKDGEHSLFFVYEDQNISPKPEIFTNALRSFKLK